MNNFTTGSLIDPPFMLKLRLFLSFRGVSIIIYCCEAHVCVCACGSSWYAAMAGTKVHPPPPSSPPPPLPSTPLSSLSLSLPPSLSLFLNSSLLIFSPSLLPPLSQRMRIVSTLRLMVRWLDWIFLTRQVKRSSAPSEIVT